MKALFPSQTSKACHLEDEPSSAHIDTYLEHSDYCKLRLAVWKKSVKQTLFSVIFNFVFCIVVSLLLLSLLLHVAIFKNYLAYL